MSLLPLTESERTAYLDGVGDLVRLVNEWLGDTPREAVEHLLANRFLAGGDTKTATLCAFALIALVDEKASHAKTMHSFSEFVAEALGGESR